MEVIGDKLIWFMQMQLVDVKIYELFFNAQN